VDEKFETALQVARTTLGSQMPPTLSGRRPPQKRPASTGIGRRLGDEARNHWIPNTNLEVGSGEKTRFPPSIPPNGEGGNRTHDTTIFSRVLYQLSYLAGNRKPLEKAGF
jgi:hypothetical protein